MIERHELSALAQSLGRKVKEYVAAALAIVHTRLDALDQQIKSIPSGARGEKGDKGEVGENGTPGLSIKGDTGERGLNGDTGAKGDKGDVGEAGEKGDRGLTGDTGAQGEPGTTGPHGAQGIQGDPGEKGQAGLTGEKGLDGKDGRDGRDGISGKDGRDGEAGRDALQIEILPAIETAKSYPRGTFAKHAGGLIRALRSTDPIDGDFIKAGWEVVIAGLTVFEVRQDTDPRVFVFITTRTGEIPSTMRAYIPALIYREIFKEGTEYTQGDVVTWGGSAWHCQVDSTKSKPGTGNDWKLMVKEGRSGKDGKDGERGPQGPAGKDLRPMGIRQ